MFINKFICGADNKSTLKNKMLKLRHQSILCLNNIHGSISNMQLQYKLLLVNMKHIL